MNRTTLVTSLGITLALAAALGLTGCADAPKSSSSKTDPAAQVEPIGDTGIKKLTLTEKAVQRLAVDTFPVSAVSDGNVAKLVVPYKSLLYLPNGKAFVYTNPSPAVYVRQEVTVESISGARVLLTAGPPADTLVVTTGGAELWGTEFGVK